ncbi:MAG TPA: type II toxin-antitoxin system VapB family antitoxin [Dehalococcoidia bacterium]|jgi:Arc/MetJ family transcription regulator|nr:type II toxin-antitoxin system VapB family antitoxin [Dehalococcoidia bacterium]
MRTTIDLDETLIEDVMRETALPTKKAAIEEALRELLNARRRARYSDLMGSGAIDMTLEELLAWRRMGIPRVD